MPHPELIFFFFLIALIYASVGFGGGSSYLAVMAMYALPHEEMKLTALLCNIVVVTGGTIIFIRNKEVNWRKIIPLIAVSVPMAFMGARIKLSQDVFFILLGCSLIAASVLLWIKNRQQDHTIPEGDHTNIIRELLLGGAIGLLSGMVGIGGGIFLAPVLNLMKWDNPRKIAATASLFILVNSVSGIAGQLSNLPQQVNVTRIGLLCIAVLVGGQIGSRMGTLKFGQLLIKRVTAVLVFVAGVEVLIKHIH